MQELERLLARSAELELTIISILDLEDFSPGELDPRLDAGIRLTCVSMEHGAALRQLVASGFFPSAVGLKRTQFEAFVRAAWAVWAAKDVDISRLQAPLTLVTEKDARKLTGLSEMLTQLEGKAPAGLVQMVNVFRSTSLAALNSFVHGGIHVLARDVTGYPEHLVGQVVRNSNGLLTMAGMLLALLAAGEDEQRRTSKLQPEFVDCLPPLQPEQLPWSPAERWLPRTASASGSSCARWVTNRGLSLAVPELAVLPSRRLDSPGG